MKIALCQINTTVGDFAGNVHRIADYSHRAFKEGAQLAVFPELAVCGYPPEDLLLRGSFLRAHDRALHELGGLLPPDLVTLVGCLEENPISDHGGHPLHNAVAMLVDGLTQIVARKSLLPTYDVFDEARFFEPWPRPEQNVVMVRNRRVGIAVCEDGWNDAFFFDERRYAIDPVERLVGAGAEVIVNLSASPWARGRETFRYRMVRAAADRHGIPMLYVNLVGGNVGLQFDGSSLAVKQTGVAFQPSCFEEGMWIVDTDEPWEQEPEVPAIEEMHYRALVQGIRDYGHKFGFPDVVVGLSGGIDSALTATLAADALGPEHVMGIAMPSSFSSAHSVEDASMLAKNLGIRYQELPIATLQDAFERVLDPVFSGTEPGVAEENVQARTRGVLLMAYANKHGHMLLTTGNKSECAVGYCTLYGDMCGALAVIADLWKTEVYSLARWINRDGERIPARTLEKPPSAELRPEQLDTDSLPPYEELDPALKCLVEEELSVRETSERTGMDREQVAHWFRQVMQNEFKRYQYAPTVRLSDRCWVGRRVPVAHRYVER